MGLVFSMSAAVATFALLAVFGAIWVKARSKKDSPLYLIYEKYFKRSNREKDMSVDETKHYKRLSHRGGLKWGWLII